MIPFFETKYMYMGHRSKEQYCSYFEEVSCLNFAIVGLLNKAAVGIFHLLWRNFENLVSPFVLSSQ